MDCPGLYDTSKTQEEISTIIVQTVACTHPGPHAVLYIVRLGRYTEEEFGVYKRLKALFDDEITKYIIVLFTGGDELEAEGKSLTDMIHHAPASLLHVIEECGNRCLVFNNKAKNPKPQVEKLLQQVRKMMEDNDEEKYTCPKYSKIGEGFEAEVQRRLAEVEQKDLEREKDVQKLEAKTKAAEKAVEEAGTELERNNQRREQEIEQAKERLKKETERFLRDLEAKKREMDAERRKLEEKATQEEKMTEKQKEEDEKRDEEELARLRENLKAKESELDAETTKQEEKALHAEIYRMKEEENLRKKKQEAKLREEEELARLQQQMKELEMGRREVERREQKRKERAYQVELNRMKDGVAKSAKSDAEAVVSVVSAPFKLVSSWFG